MTEPFNPYREWLGLDNGGSVPSHYELLGLPPGDLTAEAIHAAAERVTVRVRGQRPGPHAAAWARLLDEIQAAKKCLLDPASKAHYDRQMGFGGAVTTPSSGGWGHSDQGDSAAPRMQVETVTTPMRDLLPPGLSSPASSFAATTTSTIDVAPRASNPAMPVPSSVTAVPSGALPAEAQTTTHGGANWLPPSTSPVAAWSTPTSVAPPMSAGAPPAPAWIGAITGGSPPGAYTPPSPPQAYASPNPMDPMLPPSFAAPYAAMPPAGPPAPGYPAGAYPYSPNPMDPMAPAAYGTASPYPGTSYAQPPAATTQSNAYGYGPQVPYAAAVPPAYAAPDPMQPMGVPTAAYAPAMNPYGSVESAIPTALPAGVADFSLGIGPPASATPAMGTAIPVAAAAPISTGVPVAAGIPVGVASAPTMGTANSSAMASAAPESEVSVRTTRYRKGGNGLLLAGIGGGVLLLAVAVTMFVMNQTGRQEVAQNRPPNGEKEPVPQVPRSTSPMETGNENSSATSSGENSSSETSAPLSVPPAEMKNPTSPPGDAPEMKPEPDKPEPEKPMMEKPAEKPSSDKPSVEPMKPTDEPKTFTKPTAEQLAELSMFLTSARQALRELDFETAAELLKKADALPKLEEQAVVTARLTQLAEHAKAYRQAFEQGKEKVAAGQKLIVTASTQPEVTEVDAEKITISNKGEKRSYTWDKLPTGLFYAIADSSFETGDVQQKIQRGAYMIALANDAKEAEKGKTLWQEAIDGGAPLALLLPVIEDKYDAAKLEAVASVDKPEMKPETPPTGTPSTDPPTSSKPRPTNKTAALPLLKRARDEISGHQFSEAQKLLEQAKPLLASDEQEAKHQRLTMLLDYAKQFKEAIDRTLARMETGNTFEVGKTVVAMVEARPREVVVRVNGTNRTYQRNEMPIGMAVVLGDMSLKKDTPEAKVMRGAYVVACSSKPEEIEKAKTWWEEASRSVNIKNLMPVITDTYNK